LTNPELNDLKMREGDDTTLISSSTEFQPGQSVGGRYEVISRLGKGGMGLVYRVKQIFVNKEFALKTIDKNCMTDIAIRRFQQEARTAFSLDHPSIITVNDFGVLDDQTPFLVMELINGETLGELLKRTGCLTLEQAIPIFVQACFGLAYAHQCGVVHRDIKPNNIMIVKGLPLGAEGSVKILDFGIAKFTEHEGGEMQALTRTGEIFGSPLYMSPEQCTGVRVDHRADIYSLGCVFFEALTGAPPCVGENALSTMMKHQTEAPLTLKEASLGSDFPQAIEDIVATMLAKSPDSRYQNLGIVAHDLGALRRGDSISADAKSFRAASQAKDKSTTISISRNKFYGLMLCIALLAATIAAVSGYRAEEARKADRKERDAALTQTARLKGEVEALKTQIRDGKSLAVLPTGPVISRRTANVGDGKEDTIFHFPQGQDFGSFTEDGVSQKKATGEVRLAAPPYFKASETFLQNPTNFKVFEPNDLWGLDLQECIPDQQAGQIMQQVGRLTGLRILALDSNDGINDGALGAIEKLPKLEHLSINETKIGGAALAKLPNLRQIKILGFGKCRGASNLLKALKHNNHMTELYLDRDPLTAGDFTTIGTIAELRILHLNGTGMRNAGMSSLASLTKLEDLDASDCLITRDAIPALKMMVQNGLKKLSLSADGFSKADVDLITKMLPPGRAYFKVNSKEDPIGLGSSIEDVNETKALNLARELQRRDTD
jgi:serine/threonine protein kinase